MAAQLLALGQITTVVAGTPVPISPGLPAAPVGQSANLNVHAIIFSAIPTNTAKVYIGLSNMVKGTGVGVLMVLPIPTVNLIPTFSISLTMGPNAINAGDLFIDSDTSGQGCLVSAILA